MTVVLVAVMLAGFLSLRWVQRIVPSESLVTMLALSAMLGGLLLAGKL